jgi:hypothetical protein
VLEVPDAVPDDVSGAVELPESATPVFVLDAVAGSALFAAGLALPPDPPRKSVAYQPLPFS